VSDAGPILVTGATGFLGGRLVHALVARGETVRLMHRPGRADAARAAVPKSAPGKATLVEGDVTAKSTLLRSMAGCRAVMHAAALVARGGRRVDFDRVNVDGLANVIEAAQSAGVERIVYTSSFFALGPSDPCPGVPGPAEGLGEDALRPGAPELDHYQASKHHAALLARAAAAGGAPLVSLYPGALVGPGPLTEGNFVTAMILGHLRGAATPLPEGGRRRWCFVHVDDVAAGHLLALDRGRPGETYVLGGENRTLVDVFEVVEALTGRRPPRWSVPHPLPWLVGLGEEILHAVTGRPPRQLTRGVARVLRREWALCSEKARRELAYAPRPLEDTVRDTLGWLEAARLVPRGTVRGFRP
jgi:farnesol dehydrogenase